MNQRPSIKVFDEWRIRKAITDQHALASAERAFRALGNGLASVPPPLGWEFPHVNGEVHLKGAHLHGSSMFTFKVATGFYSNVEMGLPTGSGFVLIFDAETGFPRGILADNGYLTDLRTAAAGGLQPVSPPGQPRCPECGDVRRLGAGHLGPRQPPGTV